MDASVSFIFWRVVMEGHGIKGTPSRVQQQQRNINRPAYEPTMLTYTHYLGRTSCYKAASHPHILALS
jgi:hypothetical protein